MQEFNQLTMGVIHNWEEIEKEGLNEYVTIKRGKIEEIALQIANEPFTVPNWRRDGVYPKGNVPFMSHTIAAGVFNFAFYLPDKKGERYKVKDPNHKGGYFIGSEAMGHRINCVFGEDGIRSNLASWFFTTERGIAALFEGENQIPYPELRLKTGRDFIKGIDRYFLGDTMEVIKDIIARDLKNENRYVIRAFNNGDGLVERLIQRFPVAYGADFQMLYGRRLTFAKRAQLVPLIIHGRALDSEGLIPSVEDVDKIGPIADYQVQRALRFLKMISYSDEMARRVDNWIPLEKDSPMEVEGRAATVYTVSSLLEIINSNREEMGLEKINISHLDSKLWLMGRADKNSNPHITRTSSY